MTTKLLWFPCGQINLSFLQDVVAVFYLQECSHNVCQHMAGFTFKMFYLAG